MSRVNGDKSRYNRERKQNILRRKKIRALLQAAEASKETAAASKKVKTVPSKEAVAQK